MVGRLRDGSAATIPRALEKSHDSPVAPFPCHLDQAAVMQSVPFGIGARVEQELDRLQVSFPHGEMDCRGVPVLRAAEPWIPVKQHSQSGDIAVARGGQRLPYVLALVRLEVVRFDHRAGDRTNDGLDVRSQGVPREVNPYCCATARCASAGAQAVADVEVIPWPDA